MLSNGTIFSDCQDSPLALEWPSLSRRCLCHDPSLVCVGPLFSACGGALFRVTLGLVLQAAQLSLTNRSMPVCKVVEVLQDFLSEYVDKKFTRDYNVIMYLSIFNSFRVIRCLSQCVKSKNLYFYHIFVSPGDAPVAITQNVA